ncbi:MAG: DUF2442 domain-containing protein [Desulfobacteraceae bacterium]|nr:DUF2442 domain-containing protein [Desulfobacteraceae bacterium]
MPVKYHHINDIRFINQSMIIDIDGEKKVFDLNQISKSLADASENERSNFEISPSGYGIHWPLLDEDLSIDGLLGISHLAESGKVSI